MAVEEWNGPDWLGKPRQDLTRFGEAAKERRDRWDNTTPEDA